MNAPSEGAPGARDHDRRIERLLADAEAATGPGAWSRVEALITALVELYGEGISRLLGHARGAADAAEFDRRIARDELVASLLVLHDLHPVPLEARVERALERVRAEVPHSTPLSAVAIEDGVLALAPREGRGTVQLPTSEIVARAVEAEAPELAGIQIAGGGASRDDGLIPPAQLVRGRGA